jgi:hypothetical protein
MIKSKQTLMAMPLELVTFALYYPNEIGLLYHFCPNETAPFGAFPMIGKFVICMMVGKIVCI